MSVIPQTNNGSSNGQSQTEAKSTVVYGAARIVHFDATLVRKNKMREKALSQTRGAPSASTSDLPPATSRLPNEEAATSHGNGSSNGNGHSTSLGQMLPPHSDSSLTSNGSSGHSTYGNGARSQSNGQNGSPATPPSVPPELSNGNGSHTPSAPLAVRAKDVAPPPEQLEHFLINFVVEQTGYPAEIVEMDADLEADLGIDSIKKAQLFGELREYFEMTPTEDMTLDDFPTLRHVFEFLRQGQDSDGTSETANTVTSASAEISTGEPANTVLDMAPSATPAPTTETVSAPTPKSSAPAADQLEPFLINFVVEQTGYPAEIVEMDADLEADLGIDSIKKAQLFGELREYFDITPTEEITLDDFPTLRDVMNFLQGTHGKQQSSAPAHEAVVPASTPPPPTTVTAETPVTSSAAATPISDKAPSAEQLEPFLINFVVEQTGYPAEIVEMDADLEADLGIDSIKKAQLFGELREYFDITPTEEITLDDFPTLRDVMKFLQGTHEKQQLVANDTTSLGSDASLGSDGLSTSSAESTDTPTTPTVSSPTATAAVQTTDKAPPPEQLESFLINFVVEQTGYPAEIVEMDADLEADLGIDSIKKAQLFGELREYFEITPTEDLTLDDFVTLRNVMSFLQGTHPKSKSAATATVAAAPTSSASGLDVHENEKANTADVPSILQAVSQILKERNMADGARTDLTGNTRLIEDVGLDSVGMLDLITAVEKQFSITISLEDLEVESLNRSGAFAELVARKLAEKT
ncbi:MAG: phosphopantetheine-binding protein [Pirellulaceae bacterium]|nr:phosphopantetheine-binding protein [Pirellulaceae bacterium]